MRLSATAIEATIVAVAATLGMFTRFLPLPPDESATWSSMGYESIRKCVAADFAAWAEKLDSLVRCRGHARLTVACKRVSSPRLSELSFGGREKIKELEENLPKVLPRICSLWLCTAELTRRVLWWPSRFTHHSLYATDMLSFQISFELHYEASRNSEARIYETNESWRMMREYVVKRLSGESRRTWFTRPLHR